MLKLMISSTQVIPKRAFSEEIIEVKIKLPTSRDLIYNLMF